MLGASREAGLAELARNGARPGVLCLAMLAASLAGAEVEPRSHLQRSALLLEQGNLLGAESEARQALEHADTKTGAMALLGSIRLQQERYEEGIDLLERAIEADPAKLPPRLNLAQASALLGRHQRAAQAYRGALAVAPNSQAAQLGLVRAETELGNFREALAQTRDIADLLRSSPEGLLLLARACAGAGDAGAAAGIGQAWADLGRVPADWGARLGSTLADGGLTSEAAKVFEQLKRGGLASFDVAFNLGELYRRSGQFGKAAENYQLALRFEERSAAALRELAGLAERNGEWERARTYLARAAREQPTDPGLHLAVGTAALRLGQASDAVRDLRRSLELRGEHRETRYMLGVALGATGKHGEALALLRGLLGDQPRDPRLHLAIGLVLYLESSFEEAARHFEAGRGPATGGAVLPRYYLAMATQAQGRHAEATGMLEEIIADYPGHAPAHVALGASLSNSNRHAEADRSFETALRLAPQSARANGEYARHLRRAGRRKAARRQMRVAAGLSARESEPEAVGDLLQTALVESPSTMTGHHAP